MSVNADDIPDPRTLAIRQEWAHLQAKWAKLAQAIQTLRRGYVNCKAATQRHIDAMRKDIELTDVAAARYLLKSAEGHRRTIAGLEAKIADCDDFLELIDGQINACSLGTAAPS